MQRSTISILVLLALLVIGAVFVLRSGPSTAPSLTVTAPSGGEHWQSGETHAISWKTSGVPAGDKISVTIRRLPPPPLPTEGQEFDPIVFTDLPNTGSTTWTISPMYPGGTYVLGVTAYASTPVTNPISAESAPFTITHPKLAIDLYPLYTGVSWNPSEAEAVTIGTTTYAGALMTSAVVDAGMDPGSVFMPFLNYYARLMREHGWHEANDLAAGGHTGGQVGYRNGPGTILLGFHIDYKNKPVDAPSECPCDVSFSLFSSGATN